MEDWKIVIYILINFSIVCVTVGVWADHVHDVLFEMRNEIKKLDKKLNKLMNKDYDEEI